MKGVQVSMKKLSLFLLAVSMSMIVFGQTSKVVNGDTINKTDSKGMKQGYWEESVNSVLVKGKYEDNLKDGTWTIYSGKGLVNKIESYNDGKKDGIANTIDDNGYYKAEANYRNDMLDGVQRTFASGGRLISESYYKKGLLNGLKKNYYESTSKIQEEGNYVNGERDGVSKWYNTEGKLLAEYIYKKGNFDGINKNYYTDGNVQSEDPYVNNIENGVYKEYYDTSLVASKPPTAGSAAPAANNVSPDAGKLLKITGSYFNGKKEGKWIEYDLKGNIRKTTYYKDDIEKK